MKRTLLVPSLVLAFASLQAHAIGRIADVTVVDRQTGLTLPVHYHRGEYWVAGKPGARYAISVRNRLGQRVLAVPSVDGVNVLSGETAAWDQTGYVFSPNETYQITGWRKSDSDVAAFEFSAASDSYAGRTGRPDHVGVIGVALFRERLPEPVTQAPAWPWRGESSADSSTRLGSAAPSPAAPPASPSQAQRNAAESSARAQDAPGREDSLAKAAPSYAPLPTPKLGTGHGQRETSLVSHTRFERLQPGPNEIIRIRYDSRENLVATGVIREPASYPPVPVPQPFPQSAQTPYVADPPLQRY